MESTADDDRWRSAADASRGLSAALSKLRLDREGSVSILKSALGKPGEIDAALILLSCLGTSFTADLLPELVRLVLSHRYTLQVRQVLGRMPYLQASEILPPLVFAQLDATADDDAYRRMAEMLKHLGLQDSLASLCAQAAESADEAVREVAIDFS
jgi:hypothetical protein